MISLDENDRSNFPIIFDTLYKGNKHAIQLALDLTNLLHAWDDLVDGDKDITAAAINKAFMDALTKIAISPLWDESMATTMRSVFYRWQAANEFEKHKRDENELSKAWMLRAGFYDLYLMLAERLYGPEWAEEISPTIYQCYGEQRTDFIKEMNDGS